MGYFAESLDIFRDQLMLNEAYVGKTPTLEAIEKKIGEIRPKIKYSGANSTLKEVLELNRLFEKQFGMDVFALKVYPTSYPNAYTTVFANTFDIAEDYVSLAKQITADASNGYRFKPGNNFCIICYIATSILVDPQYTDEEVVAILLHELGHNFADCIYGDIELADREMMIAYKKFIIFVSIMYALTIVGIPIAIQNLKNLNIYSNKNRRKSEHKNQKVGKGKVKSIVDSMGARFRDFSSLAMEIASRIFDVGYIKNYKRFAKINHEDEKNKKSLGRQNEILADKFAGIYGYGPAQATALLKLNNTPSIGSKAISKLGKLGESINQRYDDAIKDLHDFDVHPHVIQRIMEEIKLLENELAKEDLDPKMKKVIEAQLKQLNDILDDATKVTKEMSKSEKAIALYNQFIRRECPDSVEKEIEDKIEKALDDALNGKD